MTLTERETAMLVIQSKPYETKEVQGPEVQMLLEDIDNYSVDVLKDIRKQAYVLLLLRRLTHDELKLMIGHIDWTIKDRNANDREVEPTI